MENFMAVQGRVLAQNRRARFEYDILKTFEVGIELKGTEVKSIREGKINLSESYCRVTELMEGWLMQCHISAYDFGNRHNHDPVRPRRLLLHKGELRRLYGQIREAGLTIVPLKVYLKKGLIKLEIALVKGKKIHDKRESLKKKEINREMERALKARD
jgi:SsrA-binding protein